MIQGPDHNRYEQASSGALRVSLNHVNEAFKRTRKAQQRLDATESEDMVTEGQAGFELTRALASLDRVRSDIKAELDERGEPYEK